MSGVVRRPARRIGRGDWWGVRWATGWATRGAARWRACRRAEGERGQVLLIFALSLSALVGMLALVVDAGILYGQRRFAQNGADAAAFAAGRLLASSGATTEDALYREVRRYAGLSPTSLTSSVPPAGAYNVPAGLASRSRLAATLEFDNGDGWCVAPGRPVPPRQGAPARTCGASPPAFDSARPYRVRVIVSHTVDAFFARAIGLGDLAPPAPASDEIPACLRPAGASGLTTCAQAVVTVRDVPGPNEYAVFASQTDCRTDGVTGTGSSMSITGGVHSNSALRFSGSSMDLTGAVTVACPNGGRFTGSGGSINDQPIPPAAATQVGTQPLPVNYTATDFPCTRYFGGAVTTLGAGPYYATTVPKGDLRFSGSSLSLTPGVYCANGDIEVSGSSASGQVTFVATGQIQISGSSATFTPFLLNTQAVSFRSGGSQPAIRMSGSSISVRGLVFAPNGEVDFSGSSGAVVNAALVANRVHLSGSSWTLTGAGIGVRDRQRVAALTA